MYMYDSQMLDLALSQAIDRYRDMSANEAASVIIIEWPEQIAAMLMEFLFRTTCANPPRMTEFVQIPREDDDTTYFVPVCSCELSEWRDL